MIVHPDLQALRSDPAPQREAQARMARIDAAWRERDDVRAVLADLERLAGGGRLADRPALAALFEDGNPAARNFAARFADMMTRALVAAPLGHFALRHATDGTLSVLQLARAGGCVLSLVAIDGEALATRPAPRSVDFCASEIWEHVLAGDGEAELVGYRDGDARRALLDRAALALRPGTVLSRDALRQAVVLHRVSGCLVKLQLQRRHPRPEPTREYDLRDGTLLHLAAGDPRDSRIEMMIALLGRMKRADAAPFMGEIARGEGGDAMRWQALRHCLALDTAKGFDVLQAIADRAADSLAPSAASLRDQLVASYPQLAARTACPA